MQMSAGWSIDKEKHARKYDKYKQMGVIQYPWSFTTTMLTGFADPQNVMSVNNVWTWTQTSDHAPRCGTHSVSNFQEEIGPQWVPVRFMKRLNVNCQSCSTKLESCNCAWRCMPPQCHHRSRSPSWLQHVQHFWDQIGLSSPTLLVQFSQKRGTYFWERAQGQVSLCISAARRRKASLLSSRPLQRPGRLPETLRFATRHSGHSCRLTRLKIHSNSFNRLHPFNPFQIISNASEQRCDLRCDMRTQCSKQHRGTPATESPLYFIVFIWFICMISFKESNNGDLLICIKRARCEHVGPQQTHQAPVSWNRLVDSPYQHDAFDWRKDLSICYHCCAPGLLLGNYVLRHLTTAFALCKLSSSPHLQGRAPRES